MWSDEKQRRLDDLRRRGGKAALTEDERREMEQLLSEIECEEWTALRPGLDSLLREQQLRARLSELQTQNAVVGALAERYADLLDRAEAQLAALTRERDLLRAEYDRVVG